MEQAIAIREQFGKLGMWGAAIVLVTTVLTFMLPLDPPAPTAEAAAAWLNNIEIAYVAGWANQYIAMVTCTIIFAAAGMAVYQTAPMRAIIVWTLTVSSFVIFSITKFMSLWTVPLLVKSLAAGTEPAEAASAVLLAISPLIAFGLIPSLDYLGFWFYGLIGLVIFRPLFRLSTTAKIAALSWALFGVGFHLMYVAMVADLVSQAEIAAVSLGLGLFVIIGNLLLFFDFRRLGKAGG